MVTKRRAQLRLWTLVAVLGAGVAAAVLWSGGADLVPGGDDGGSAWSPAVAAEVGGPLDLALGATAAETAELAAGQLLVEAPVVVVVPVDDRDAIAAGLELGVELRAPLLFADEGASAGRLRALVEQLGSEQVVTLAGAEVPANADVEVFDGSVEGALDDFRTEAQDTAGAGGGIVLVRPGDAGARYAAPAIAAAGHEMVPLATADPRADARATDRLRRLDREVVAVAGTSDAWEGIDRLALKWQARVAGSGNELPGGGQIMFPFRVMVALYGTPESGALGILGEQDLEGSIARAKQLARSFQPFSDVPVVPAFELIATVATGGPGDVGDFSRRVPRDIIRRWVDVAGREGVYVVLDLQPGRTDFLTQAKELGDLLLEPHVGLALDAEWRLGPDEEPLEQIGSVGIDEVNAVGTWLADLTRNNRLPQKLLLLHQFNLDMIRDRAQLDTSRSELAYAIQMDGQGTQAAKLQTWDQLRTVDPPSGVWWGWKNFLDEDPTVRSPRDTLALDPVPVFVSYQ